MELSNISLHRTLAYGAESGHARTMSRTQVPLNLHVEHHGTFMTAETLSIKAEMLIRTPQNIVFEAFVDPAVTTNFWFTKSSGSLIEGATVKWEWEMYGVSADVAVVKIEKNTRILIEWPTPVEWTFSAKGDQETFVEINAGGFEGDFEEQIAGAIDSMGGFNLVLAGCKAWLEHGLHLNLIGDKSPDHHV